MKIIRGVLYCGHRSAEDKKHESGRSVAHRGRRGRCEVIRRMAGWERQPLTDLENDKLTFTLKLVVEIKGEIQHTLI